MYQSVLCGVAASVDYPHPTNRNLAITERCYAYINQLQLVFDAYAELEDIHSSINSADDKSAEPNHFSAYDLRAVDRENHCRDYSYLLITSLKSLLDIFACLVEETLTETVIDEDQMTDIRKIRRGLNKPGFQPMLAAFERFNRYLWINNIAEIRNRLIHRGYRTKPDFGFRKSDDLTIKILSANNPPYATIKIGQLFEEFITSLPEMEKEVSNILISLLPTLQQGPRLNFFYRAGGGITEYIFKETD